ncbi:MAG: hypothetical protein PHN49_12025, partial [Candidatus Omnitrophica bacterium]|nr:hypothetical protein [Candidatus Omnitrophota bacterium]
LLKDHRFLKHLFNLELSPEDYTELIKRGPGIRPRQVIGRFLALNREGRVRDIEFSHVAEIERLFSKALNFYRGAKERDQWMLKNIEDCLKKTKKDKAVVITGGFHAGPFAEFFKERDYNYALITPKVTDLDHKGRENYVRSILQGYLAPFKLVTSTYRDVSKGMTSAGNMILQERNPVPSDAVIAREIFERRMADFSPASRRASTQIQNELTTMPRFRPYHGVRVERDRHEGKRGHRIILGADGPEMFRLWLGPDDQLGDVRPENYRGLLAVLAEDVRQRSELRQMLPLGEDLEGAVFVPTSGNKISPPIPISRTAREVVQKLRRMVTRPRSGQWIDAIDSVSISRFGYGITGGNRALGATEPGNLPQDIQGLLSKLDLKVEFEPGVFEHADSMADTAQLLPQLAAFVKVHRDMMAEKQSHKVRIRIGSIVIEPASVTIDSLPTAKLKARQGQRDLWRELKVMAFRVRKMQGPYLQQVDTISLDWEKISETNRSEMRTVTLRLNDADFVRRHRSMWRKKLMDGVIWASSDPVLESVDGHLRKRLFQPTLVRPDSKRPARDEILDPTPPREVANPAWMFGHNAPQLLYHLHLNAREWRMLAEKSPTLMYESLLTPEHEVPLGLTDENSVYDLLIYHRVSGAHGFVNSYGIGGVNRLHDHVYDEELPIDFFAVNLLEQNGTVKISELRDVDGATTVFESADDHELARWVVRQARELQERKIPYQTFLSAGKVIFIWRDENKAKLWDIEMQEFSGEYLTAQAVGGLLAYPDRVLRRFTPESHRELLTSITQPKTVRDEVLAAMLSRSETRPHRFPQVEWPAENQILAHVETALEIAADYPNKPGAPARGSYLRFADERGMRNVYFISAHAAGGHTMPITRIEPDGRRVPLEMELRDDPIEMGLNEYSTIYYLFKYLMMYYNQNPAQEWARVQSAAVRQYPRHFGIVLDYTVDYVYVQINESGYFRIPRRDPTNVHLFMGPTKQVPNRPVQWTETRAIGQILGDRGVVNVILTGLQIRRVLALVLRDAGINTSLNAEDIATALQQLPSANRSEMRLEFSHLEQRRGKTVYLFSRAFPDFQQDAAKRFLESLPKKKSRQSMGIMVGGPAGTMILFLPGNSTEPDLNVDDVMRFVSQEKVMMQLGPWYYQLAGDKILVYESNDLEHPVGSTQDPEMTDLIGGWVQGLLLFMAARGNKPWPPVMYSATFTQKGL